MTKRLLYRADDRVVAWATLLFALPWLSLGLLFSGWPALTWAFWGRVAVLVPLELTAYLCYLRAIRISPLSLTVPFLALTPLLTVFTGWLFLGETVSGIGFLGVMAMTVGAYVLQVELVPQGLLEPIRAMFRTPGIRLMMVTAVLYSITAPVGKQAIVLAGPEAFPFIYFSVDVMVLTGFAWRGAQPSGGLAAAVRPQWVLFGLTGLVIGGMLLTHCVGIAQAPVAYFIAIKRLSLLVSVLYGGLFFKEEKFLQRFLGVLLMVLGVALITLSA